MQGFAQLAIVIKLAVENYGDIVGFIPDGLVAAGQVNNAEAAHAQRQAGDARFIEKKSFAIGTAMDHRGGHGPYARIGRWRRQKKMPPRRFRTRYFSISGV